MLPGPIDDFIQWLGGAITGAVRRQVINLFLPDMLAQGMSGAEALNTFREYGLGINTSEFYSIRREILGVQKARSGFKSLTLDSVPGPNAFSEYPYEINTAYRYIVNVKIRDIESGQLEDGFITVDTDFLGTKEEILELAAEKYAGWYQDKKNQIEEVVPEQAFYNPQYVTFG